MLEVLEMNKEKLEKLLTNYICEDDIYRILLNTGQYFNACDINYHNILILFLLKMIYNKERKVKKKNKTPLHIAAAKNSKEIGELLILKGADINIKDTISQKRRIFSLIQ